MKFHNEFLLSLPTNITANSAFVVVNVIIIVGCRGGVVAEENEVNLNCEKAKRKRENEKLSNEKSHKNFIS